MLIIRKVFIAFNSLGVSLHHTRQFLDAISHFDLALKINPCNLDCYSYKGIKFILN